MDYDLLDLPSESILKRLTYSLKINGMFNEIEFDLDSDTEIAEEHSLSFHKRTADMQNTCDITSAKRAKVINGDASFPTTENIVNAVQPIMNCDPNNMVTLVDQRDKLQLQPGDLTKMAQEIENAYNTVNMCGVSKLKAIKKQMVNLKSQAEKVFVEMKLNNILHSVACNFSKRPNGIYYVYEKPSGQLYFSMLSPQEWKNPPHTFIGAFKLQYDKSWTPYNIHNLEEVTCKLLKEHHDDYDYPSLTDSI